MIYLMSDGKSSVTDRANSEMLNKSFQLREIRIFLVVTLFGEPLYSRT